MRGGPKGQASGFHNPGRKVKRDWKGMSCTGRAPALVVRRARRRRRRQSNGRGARRHQGEGAGPDLPGRRRQGTHFRAHKGGKHAGCQAAPDCNPPLPLTLRSPGPKLVGGLGSSTYPAPLQPLMMVDVVGVA